MARMRTSSALELLVPLDRDGPEPLHRQLEQGIREAVRSGRLTAGAALPSTRALAAQLAVSRGIVVEAYEQLGAEGYLAITPGGVTRVAIMSRPPPTRPTSGAGHGLRRRLPAGPARSRPLPARDVAALGQAGARHRPEPAARLSRRARDARAARCPGGLPQSRPGHGRRRRFDRRLLRVRAGPQARRPGPARPRRAPDRHRGSDPAREPRGPARDRSRGRRDPGRRFRDAGGAARRRPRPGRGADRRPPVPDRRRPASRPTGGAHRPGPSAARGLVIEDDYDAEFRYDREPIGAMQGLSPDRVVYAGSASKILAPGLRLGWIVVPAELADEVAAAKKAADLGSPAIDQLAFADFLAHGELDRHLRRLRPIYRARRDVLLAALGRHLPELRPVGASAGLHLLAWLPPDLDEAEIIEAAGRSGIRLQGVGRRRPASDRDRRGGAGGRADLRLRDARRAGPRAGGRAARRRHRARARRRGDPAPHRQPDGGAPNRAGSSSAGITGSRPRIRSAASRAEAGPVEIPHDPWPAHTTSPRRPATRPMSGRPSALCGRAHARVPRIGASATPGTNEARPAQDRLDPGGRVGLPRQERRPHRGDAGQRARG